MLETIYEKIAGLKSDSRLNVVLEKFIYALSSMPISPANRFLELAISMEILLLPNTSAELSFRFRLHMARLARKNLGLDVLETYKFAGELYSVRSKLAHEGKSSKVTVLLPKLTDYTRQFIRLYLEDPAQFTSEAMEALCLE